MDHRSPKRNISNKELWLKYTLKVICLSTEHQGVHKNSFRNVCTFQDRIGIRKSLYGDQGMFVHLQVCMETSEFRNIWCYVCSLRSSRRRNTTKHDALTVPHLHAHVNCCRSKLCLQTSKISSDFFKNNLLLWKNVNLWINEETFW